ncbi:unnamed protein product [Nezara viridula]|uniref:Uncharacterized protein n=1 Tax=Nezara viridula TaxID=85310 RepID=A0A9P0HGX1_NEZVI|nr:unnamed protein product [Nezara viridula]
MILFNAVFLTAILINEVASSPRELWRKSEPEQERSAGTAQSWINCVDASKAHLLKFEENRVGNLDCPPPLHCDYDNNLCFTTRPRAVWINSDGEKVITPGTEISEINCVDTSKAHLLKFEENRVGNLECPPPLHCDYDKNLCFTTRPRAVWINSDGEKVITPGTEISEINCVDTAKAHLLKFEENRVGNHECPPSLHCDYDKNLCFTSRTRALWINSEGEQVITPGTELSTINCVDTAKAHLLKFEENRVGNHECPPPLHCDYDNNLCFASRPRAIWINSESEQVISPGTEQSTINCVDTAKAHLLKFEENRVGNLECPPPLHCDYDNNLCFASRPRAIWVNSEGEQVISSGTEQSTINCVDTSKAHLLKFEENRVGNLECPPPMHCDYDNNICFTPRPRELWINRDGEQVNPAGPNCVDPENAHLLKFEENRVGNLDCQPPFHCDYDNNLCVASSPRALWIKDGPGQVRTAVPTQSGVNCVDPVYQHLLKFAENRVTNLDCLPPLHCDYDNNLCVASSPRGLWMKNKIPQERTAGPGDLVVNCVPAAYAPLLQFKENRVSNLDCQPPSQCDYDNNRCVASRRRALWRANKLARGRPSGPAQPGINCVDPAYAHLLQLNKFSRLRIGNLDCPPPLICDYYINQCVNFRSHAQSGISGPTQHAVNCVDPENAYLLLVTSNRVGNLGCDPLQCDYDNNLCIVTSTRALWEGGIKPAEPSLNCVDPADAHLLLINENRVGNLGCDPFECDYDNNLCVAPKQRARFGIDGTAQLSSHCVDPAEAHLLLSKENRVGNLGCDPLQCDYDSNLCVAPKLSARRGIDEPERPAINCVDPAEAHLLQFKENRVGNLGCDPLQCDYDNNLCIAPRLRKKWRISRSAQYSINCVDPADAHLLLIKENRVGNLRCDPFKCDYDKNLCVVPTLHRMWRKGESAKSSINCVDPADAHLLLIKENRVGNLGCDPFKCNYDKNLCVVPTLRPMWRKGESAKSSINCVDPADAHLLLIKENRVGNLGCDPFKCDYDKNLCVVPTLRPMWRKGESAKSSINCVDPPDAHLLLIKENRVGNLGCDPFKCDYDKNLCVVPTLHSMWRKGESAESSFNCVDPADAHLLLIKENRVGNLGCDPFKCDYDKNLCVVPSLHPMWRKGESAKSSINCVDLSDAHLLLIKENRVGNLGCDPFQCDYDHNLCVVPTLRPMWRKGESAKPSINCVDPADAHLLLIKENRVGILGCQPPMQCDYDHNLCVAGLFQK